MNCQYFIVSFKLSLISNLVLKTISNDVNTTIATISLNKENASPFVQEPIILYRNISSTSLSVTTKTASTTTPSLVGVSTSAVVTIMENTTVTEDNGTTEHTTILESCSANDSSCQQMMEPVMINKMTDRNITNNWKYYVSSLSNRTSFGNETAIEIDIKSVINVNNYTADNVATNYTMTNSSSELENQTISISKITEKKSSNTKFKLEIHYPCNCDIKKGACDINCCCDIDCEFVNRDIFDNCSDALMEDEQNEYCPSRVFNSAMFCVVKDNLYSKHYYEDKLTIDKLEEIKRALHRNDLYGWSLSTDVRSTNLQFEEKEYKIGSRIWLILNETKIIPFSLPNSATTERCQTKKPILYVTDTETECTHFIKNVTRSSCSYPDFSVESYYRNLSIIAFPHLLNVSDMNCKNNCVPITANICEHEGLRICHLLSNTTDLSPIYDETSSSCSNIVTSVHFELTHNGSEGIKQAKIYFETVNISATDFSGYIKQRFKVSYQWCNQTDYFEKSGSPGYIRRKPIILGYKRKLRTNDNQIVEKMSISHNSTEWLTTFQPNEYNACSKEIRRNVLFGQNIYVHCYLNISGMNAISQNCDKLQKEIWRIIFGPAVNISVENTYISAFGDPDIDNVQKWVPILSETPLTSSSPLNESCYGIITSIKIDILYSITGDYNWPQNTIFGATLTSKMFENNIEWTSSSGNLLQISTVVNFYDITHKPIRLFAEPPTYEIKLPPDFFYPFFSGSSSLNISRYYIYLLFAYFIYTFGS